MYFSPGQVRGTATVRSKLMLEIAAELVGMTDWTDRQVRIQFRPQGGDAWNVCFFASDAPGAIDAVTSGEADIAIVNPGAVLAMALNGAGPFKKPVPVRAIYVIGQLDHLGFAVAERTGLKSLADIRDRKYPLKVSLRGQRDHSVLMLIDQVLSEMGFSLEDIESWGGMVRYDEGMPYTPHRIGAIASGELDAVFDEALPLFAPQAIEAGCRFLPIEHAALKRLEAKSIPLSTITQAEYPDLREELVAVNFSGWPIFCLESTPDELVRLFCTAMDARQATIPGYRRVLPLPLASGLQNTPEAPLTIPFHRAAEAYWRERGYVK